MGASGARDRVGQPAGGPASSFENKPKNAGAPLSAPQPSAPSPTPDPAARRPLLPLSAGPPSVKPSGAGDPYAFWSDYFARNDETADQLHETVRLLNRSGKTRDVHAAILGYLQQRPKNAEFWMYEALALAIEMNGGRAEDVETALNYAADLAQRTHNPNHLVSAADKLLIKGYYDRVGDLLDEAAEKVQHRAEPLLMSINLAQKIKDPQRMAESIDRLLSLGWPGQDEFFRTEARKQAEILAKTLTEEGRAAEADQLLAALPAAEARDVYIRLSWDGNADYDLVVEEPLGATVAQSMPRSVFGGALIQNGYGARPEDVYVCPRGFDGDYTARIMMVYNDPEKPTTRLTLEVITHEGTADEHKETIHLKPDDPKAKPVVAHLKDGRRTHVLPFVSPGALRRSIEEELQKRNEKTKEAPPASTKPAKPANTIVVE